MSDRPEKFKKQIPLRIYIAAPFILLMMISAMLMGTLTYRASQRASQETAYTIINNISANVIDNISTYLEHAHHLNDLIADAIELEHIDFDNHLGMQEYFWKQLFAHPDVSAIFMANTEKVFAGVERLPDDGEFLTLSDPSTGFSFCSYLANADSTPLELRLEQPDYDPNTQSYYQAALAAGDKTWADFYYFAPHDSLYMTAVQPIYDADDDLQGIIGTAFNLDFANEFLQQVDFDESGIIYIIERSGTLVATSTGITPYERDPVSGDTHLIMAAESKIPIISQSLQQILLKGVMFQEIEVAHQLAIWVEGEMQYVVITPLQDGRGLDWLVVVMIPEESLVTAYTTSILYITLLGVGIGILVILLSDIVAWRVVRPLQALNRAVSALTRNEQSEPVSTSQVAEITGLADSFNRMAERIRSLVENLEDRVVERTSDLEESKEQLEHEVAEHRKTEATLQASEKRFRSVLETISLIGVMLDADGQITFCNDYLLKLTGWERKDILGKNWFDTFIPPEISSQIYHDVFLPTIESGDFPPFYTNEIITRSGELRIIAWSNAVFRSDQGRVLNVTSIGQDITEQRRAEEALQESEARMRFALEGTEQGSWEWDMRTGEMYFDDSLASILNLSHSEIANISEQWWIEHITPKSHETSRDAIRDYFTGRKPHYELEFQARNSDDDWRWIWVRGASIERDENEKVLRMAGTFRDVTEHRRLEQTIQAVQKMASLGTLAAGVAHEINSPLQVITGLCSRYLNELERDKLDVNGLGTDLNIMNRNAWRIAQIVRSLLVFARPSVDQVTSNSLTIIIDDTLLLIEHQLRSWQNVTIKKELPKDLPPLFCDQNGITQVLINLLNNAADAMPAGGIITLRAHHDSKNEALVLEVIDTGTGITDEVRRKIFDPFYTTKEIGRGTGLGLSIVQSIVGAHGGTVRIESEPQQGTAFILRLPLKPPVNPQDITDSSPDRFDISSHYPEDHS